VLRAYCSLGVTVVADLFDDFPGSSLDSSKWTGPFDRQSDQVNGEVNALLAANVTIGSSLLSIAAKHEDAVSGDRDVSPPHNFTGGTTTFHYTSGQIQTVSLFGPPAGGQTITVEARLKPPSGTGVWPCFWMLGNAWQASQPYTANVAGHNWPNNAQGWWEIDIAEFMLGARTTVNCQAHVGSADSAPQQTLPYNATSRFMVYRLQWSTTSLIWSVDPEDGSGYQTLRTETDSARIPITSGYVILNQAVGGVGGGTPNDPDFPMTMQIDWVRVT
jgi:beta-glucanase (GH16 family)